MCKNFIGKELDQLTTMLRVVQDFFVEVWAILQSEKSMNMSRPMVLPLIPIPIIHILELR